MALGYDLAQRGVDFTIIEKTDGTIIQPKMDLVGVRTMEFCRHWGITKWVRESAYPRDYRQDYIWASAVTGFEFGREPFASLDDEPCPPQSPEKRERCPQDMFDPILTRAVRSRSPSAHTPIRYRTELIGLWQGADRITAMVMSDAGEEEVKASYLVGCDGASSTVRQLLGIGMSGNPALTYTTNAIFRCRGFNELHDKGEFYRFIIIGREGTFATIVAIDGRDRYRFSIVGSEQKRTYTENELREAIITAVGRPFDFEILSIMPWVRRELVADRFRSGRVFLAGDAAHLMSPTGGFGMNTGIQDAVDLSWKLRIKMGYGGGEKLLDSYEGERRPVAIRNMREASGNLRRMLSPRDAKPPPEVFLPGDAGDAARSAFGRAYTEMMKREWFSIGIHLGYRYEGSPLIVPDGTPEPPDTVAIYEQTARPGHRAPHAWLEPGRSTLDLFGHTFALLYFYPAPTASPLWRFNPDPGVSPVWRKVSPPELPRHVTRRKPWPYTLSPWQSVARRSRLRLWEYEVTSPEIARLYEKCMVLVRPDGHVCWRGDENPNPEEIARILEVVRGA